MKGKIIFTGSFGEYFFASLGLMILSLVTLGILFPYMVYWQARYFFSHMEVEFYKQMHA